jgi:serine protease DegQ
LRNSPADIAGIKSGDVLLAINNREVTDSNSMLNIIAVLKPNEKAVLTLARNQKNIKVDVVIGKRPKPIAMRR